MAESDLRNMVMNFRVSDLQVLLGYAGKNKTGKKQELQSRAIELVKMNYPHVTSKIKELHNRRYHNQLLQTRQSNYDIPDRTLTDRPISNYESAMNNNYGARCNPNVRPMSMNHVPPPTYSGKAYLPPVPPQQHYSPYADVKFRDLPFFDMVHMLLRPFSLIPDPVDRLQENTYTFCLSPQEAHDVAVSRDNTGNYEYQILLRFCLLESGTEQDDNFPPNVTVKVNGKPVPLPNPIPTNRPGVEPKRPSKPVNITQYTKLSPTVNNMITVGWSSSYGRSYAAVLYIARCVTSMTLLQRLKNRLSRSPELTKSMIIEKLKEDQDSDIATTTLQASLLCPLGKLKMSLPCRASTCTHVACFDASLYIQLNEKKPKWRCPVCDKPALFKHLEIDGLFTDIISKVPDECTDVQLHDDGSWTPIMPQKKPKDEPKFVLEASKKNTSKPVEVVEILSSDSDTEEDMWRDPKSSNMSRDDESPPLMYIPRDINAATTPPLTSFPPPPPLSLNYSSNPQMMEPVPVCLTSNVQTEMQSSEHLNILPDIIPQTDISVPSTSSSGLGSTYPNYSSSDCAPFVAGNSDTFQEQTASESNQSSDPYSNNYFDFYSLLSMPESEQQKYESLSKDSERDTEPVPDVISLE